MDNPVRNGHKGKDELRVPTNFGSSSYRYIPVEDVIPLFVGRNHIKDQTFKLFDVGIPKQVEHKGIIMKVRSGGEVMKLEAYGHR